MEIDRGSKLENTESKNFEYGGLSLKKQYEGCIRCLELYDKITKADEKCVRVELDIGEKNSAIELLERKLDFSELKNLKLENEVRALKQRNKELEKSIRNPKDEDGNLTLLMVENKVLECDKKKAETEINAWKVKCKELEMRMLQMKSGTPTIKQYTQFEGFKGGEYELKPSFGFLGEASPPKNISPSTPGIRRPFVPIEIIDSDDDDLNTKNVLSSAGVGLGGTLDEKELASKNKFAQAVEDHSDEEIYTCYIPMPKRRKVRRQAAYVVASESESDSDDDIPLAQLGSKKNNRKKCIVRRRLQRVGENKDNNKSTGNRERFSSDEGEMEMDDSESEGESLGGFIVESSDDDLDSDFVSENDGTDSGVGYDEVMSSLRRGRKDKMNWEYEADMLADLAKCPELCMKGVCAIYRRQTTEEQSRQATLVVNGLGFSQIDASIGSDLAEFLTYGDPEGDVTKTVDELHKFNPEGVEECRRLARRYSRQLFEIYQNREDPFFHP
ncbi:hypothetical protein PHJA_000250900 [Phtheirospermum japonicum]|uniref:Uncharacterized protein n=1 Tax=Phtheirospermum japonicum TaxID=374723 RepID=A0A830B2U2_9LAMI|nr:hypothetical protein PHJA_000250900 [Phtheirospermum japonicum]